LSSECNLLKYMHLMKCPRCGFEQPEDRYCASCGADIQKLNARPKPIWMRLLQNPGFHLTLVGLLLVMVIGYILYTQSDVVSREMRTLLDLPLTSREAGEPDESGEPNSASPHDTANEPGDSAETAPPIRPPALETIPAANPPPTMEKEKKAAPKNLEISSFEIPRDTLTSLVQVADKLSEGTAGRIYYFPQGQAVADAVQKASRKLGNPRNTTLQVNAHLEMVTPVTAMEAFQFAMLVQQNKWDGNDGQVKIEANLLLPPVESNTEAGLPTVRQVNETTLSGNSPMNTGSLVLVLIDPVNRTPRAEFVQKAGEGPWNVFQSEDFREGSSDWIILVQAK
jgi:hypothetical protein